MIKLTQKYLKSILDYNPDTGVFTWIIRPSYNMKAGGAAGSINGKGYNQIRINDIIFLAHRLAWLYMTGNFPEDQTDHINRDKSDNRWCNLRVCTNGQNKANSKKPTNNTSGYKGVRWFKKNKKWGAVIGFNNKDLYLGSYANKHEAAKVYNNKAIGLFGKFALLNIISNQS